MNNSDWANDIKRYDYSLSEDLIAQHPSTDRTSSRLLVVESEGDFHELKFSNISELLRRGDLLVVNDTRVVPARLHAAKPSGGKVEIMLERILNSQHALVQLRSSKLVKEGQKLLVDDRCLVVSGREDPFFQLKICGVGDIFDLFTTSGSVPLPPYISREATELDQERYQTVYSHTPGAVAAPTAGLHFDQTLIDALIGLGVDWTSITLHVGAGTFQPVRCQNISQHKMHHEQILVNQETCDKVTAAKSRGGRVIAVGTTVVRALESAGSSGKLAPITMDTDLFISPGYKFRVVDALITNFHLPKSTLLMMVSAFAGYQRTMSAYQYAIDQKFRFFSYGDAMFMDGAV